MLCAYTSSHPRCATGMTTSIRKMTRWWWVHARSSELLADAHWRRDAGACIHRGMRNIATRKQESNRGEEKCRADVPVNIVISHSPAAARFTHSLTHLGMYVLSVDNAPCTSSASASGLSALSPASNIIMRKASGVNVQCIFLQILRCSLLLRAPWRC